MSRKILAGILAFIMCFGLLCGCAGSDKNTVFSFEGGGTLSLNFMYFTAAVQKSIYEAVIAANGGDWETVVNPETGETFTDLLYSVTLSSGKDLLTCEYLHDNVYALSLDAEQKKSVDRQIESLTSRAGSSRALEEQLSAYSADTKTLRRYLELTLKQGNLYNALYGKNGTNAVSEEAVRADFEQNYHIVQHIYFNISTKPKEDGSLVSLSDEEKQAKAALASEVYNRILAGEAFEALKSEYNEDTYESTYYPNGFFVTSDTTFPAEFTAAAIEMQPGEYRLVNDSESGVHILYKQPMDGALYNADRAVYTTILSKLSSEAFETLIASYADRIRVNEEKLAELNVGVVPAYAY